jgi:hypothetical protein
MAADLEPKYDAMIYLVKPYVFILANIMEHNPF